jgi:RNA polymerase sigma factor (sigma-70 family)
MKRETADVRSGPEGAWLAPLRERFLSIARRRVHPDVAEDLVQDALRVIVERASAADAPPLPYCFQVLRNVIGNHYQKQRVRRRRDESSERAASVPDAAPTPLEALESADAVRVVGECLDGLAATDPGCARYLRRLLAGAAPADVADEEGLPHAAFYRRVYRCRIKLRELLDQRGLFA